MKRLLWMIILVLATAFSVVFTGVDGFNGVFPPTATAVVLTETPVFTTEAPTETVPTVPSEPTLEATATETELPLPTATLEPTATVQPTATLRPTATLLPTATFTPSPTATLPPPPTATAVPFKVQPMTPIFMANFVHTEEACNWQGVAGQVFDANFVPVKNYIVKITGKYNNQSVNLVGVTGMVAGLPYGPGSYEIVLGNKPLTSLDTLSIQLLNASGDPLTTPLSFSTSADCDKNLVLINFMHK